MSEQMNTRQGRRHAKSQAKNGKQKKKRGLFKKILIATFILMTVGILAGGIAAFAIIQGAPPLDPERLAFAQAVQIYDQNDEFVSQLDAEEHRVNVSIQDVPQVLEDAFLSVEDVRFREHFGIDLRRVAGAVFANITEGFGAEGASTITQQLVKNAFLTHDKALTRKIQEQYLAIRLEQQYSKDQILEMYLNQIYLASGGYGVEAASQTFFNKSITDESFSLADAALLAGIPRRPSYYDPIHNPENAENRRNLVLSLMEQHGKITSEEAEAAKAVPIEEQLDVQEREAYPYEAFYNQVLAEVEAMEGISVSDLYNGGLKIYTTLDQEAQQQVDSVLHTDQFVSGFPANEDFQAGVTLLDTKTGQIKAIGSGREESGIQRGFNYATDIRRQPGSTIKPILDYGPAIEHLKWSTGHIISDTPHNYSNGVPIRNFDRGYEGDISMRRALARSRNVTAIKALQEVGVDRAEQFAEGLGIPIEESPMPEAYGLGGFRTGLSTLHLAGAYAAFGNGGSYTQPYTVRKIEFPDGRQIDTTPEASQAMSDYTAYMITDMLKTAVTEGTGTTANIPGLPLAGKTGTTNFSEDDIRQYGIPSEGVPDVWFAGYTTNYTAAVWTGYDRKGESNYLSGNERQLAQRIFKSIMEQVSANVDTPDFEMPNSVVRIGVERSTGLLPSDFTPESEIVYELFVRGNEPTRVSEQFQRIEAPSGFTAAYNEDTNQIIGSWTYDSDLLENISFQLQVSVDGGDYQNLSQSKDMQFIYSNIQPGSTYSFRVIAISDENSSLTSDPAQVEVTIPGEEEEDEDIPDPIDELEPGDENGSDENPVTTPPGNENGPGNGNGPPGAGEGNEDNGSDNGTPEQEDSDSDSIVEANENENEEN
ncbi:PBP1A family penicillin-binding protein [Halalkalibacterium ligniniphilum]|uniref:PBP1A family penicillin-binding protein n=1 Tax=Halalkalibacterium ligniniphilum TaxID=1134413 RepID=UPI00034933D3|nr:PBP1A family penicillin-binding protein [Halalkalibacterium ligniniphilum]